MPLLPYSKLKSENLKSLLFASRTLKVLAYSAFVVSIILTVLAFSTGLINYELDGQFSGVSVATDSAVGPGILILISGIVSSLCLLILSGLCAAIVSFEYKYTQRG